MPDTDRQNWDAETLWQRLEPLHPGLTVEVLAEAGSTNTVLLERARLGDTAASLLVAERQTQGRGRQGRPWQSAPGASLTFSLALPLAAADWSGLSLAVGLALAEALDPPVPGQTAGQVPRIGLKWPNDLMLVQPDGLPHKLGGILIESVAAAGQRMAVVGVGLNIVPQARSGLPVQALSQGYGGVQALHPALDAPATLARVAEPLLRALLAFQQAGFAPLRERYAARDLLAGQPVSTSLADLPEGVADGVDSDGALWVRAQGRRHRVSSGEVSVRATAAAPAAATAGGPAGGPTARGATAC
nr:biotin--[acetyl-CoA-carboxylase] ligase [Ideonella sp. A 288]